MASFNATQLQAIGNCRKSVTWFLRNFGRIKHPAAGILPFEAFGYQRMAIKAFRTNRMNIFKKCRQSGISKISGAFALWFAMFHPHKTILIVSRTDEDAMAFLREHIVFLFEHLPNWMKVAWKPTKQTDHSIVFPNNSIIRSLTSHPDVLRSNASSLNIIDEAAFIQGMDVMWAGGFSTLQHGGNVIVISTCVDPKTYVLTNNGLAQIGDLAQGEAKHAGEYDVHEPPDGLEVFGRSGLERPSAIYSRQASITKKVITKLGYELEGDLDHLVWICRPNEESGWANLREVVPGDFVPIMRGNDSWGNADFLGYKDRTGFAVDELDDHTAEMIGLIVAEGYIAGDYVVVTNGDAELREWLSQNTLGLCWKRDGRDTHVRCCSRPFVRFLKWLGCSVSTAPTKVVPKRLWSCSRRVVTGFLRRLFDGDGHSRTRNGEIGYTSTSRELIKQVRLLLLNLGIVCREEYHPAYRKQFDLNGRSYVSDCLESWQLIVRSGEAPKFYEAVGFGLDRKQFNNAVTTSTREFIPNVRYWLGRLRKERKLSIGELCRRGLNGPSLLFKARKSDLTERRVVEKLLEVLASDYGDCVAYKAIASLADRSIYWDVVEDATEGESETVCLSLPNDHSFWSNGLVSHNTNGVGNWYWSTWTDAEAGVNKFNPIKVDWWDMDWAIEYYDSLSREQKRIAPLDDIRECTTRLDREKYGPYWSPWLEDQWRGLQERGEGWKFEQEVLAHFIGSGNTVLDKSVLFHVNTTVRDPIHKASNIVTCIHPMTGAELDLDFRFDDPDEGFWVWQSPVPARPMKRIGNTVTDPGAPAHSYVAGVDIASGKSKDYHAVEVFDVDTMEQVAEFMARCLPRELVRFVDWIGRYYNSALLVVESNNGGNIIIDELRYGYSYPRLWRKKDINDKPRPPRSKIQRPMKVANYGFNTNQSSKATLNKYLIDNLRDEPGTGYTVYSKRLLKQLLTYVRKKDRLGRDTGKTEAEEGAGNYDDLVIATALALCGRSDAWNLDASHLPPIHSGTSFKSNIGPTIVTPDQAAVFQKQLVAKGGTSLLMPLLTVPDEVPETSAQRQLDAFTMQLGCGIPISAGRPLITPPKYYYNRKK